MYWNLFLAGIVKDYRGQPIKNTIVSLNHIVDTMGTRSMPYSDINGTSILRNPHTRVNDSGGFVFTGAVEIGTQVVDSLQYQLNISDLETPSRFRVVRKHCNAFVTVSLRAVANGMIPDFTNLLSTDPSVSFPEGAGLLIEVWSAVRRIRLPTNALMIHNRTLSDRYHTVIGLSTISIDIEQPSARIIY